MKSFATTLKRSLLSLALAGTLGIAAIGTGTVHASGAQITAVGQSNDTIYVNGSGFGSGDTVYVYVQDDAGNLVTAAETTSTTPGHICNPKTHQCYWWSGGAIGVYTDSIYVPPCSPTAFYVYAIDETTGQESNTAIAWLGGPVC